MSYYYSDRFDWLPKMLHQTASTSNKNVSNQVRETTEQSRGGSSH